MKFLTLTTTKTTTTTTTTTTTEALSRSLAPNRLKIGNKTSKGLGAGGKPSVGAEAAEESREDIMAMVENADLVFVTAGMGGGTGSGAAPIVAECAKLRYFTVLF